MKFLSILALVSIGAVVASPEVSTNFDLSSDVFEVGGINLSDNTLFDSNGFFKLNPEVIKDGGKLEQNARPAQKEPYGQELKRYFTTNDPIEIATQKAEFPLGPGESIFGARLFFKSVLGFLKRNIARSVNAKAKIIHLKHKRTLVLLAHDLSDFLRGKESRWNALYLHINEDFKKHPITPKRIRAIHIFFEACFTNEIVSIFVTFFGEIIKHNPVLGKICVANLKGLEKDYSLFTSTFKTNFNTQLKRYKYSK